MIRPLAEFPHKVDSRLGMGHSIPNGDPPKPYSGNVGFCGPLLLPPLTVAREFSRLRVNNEKVIEFFAVVPLIDQLLPQPS